MPVVIGHSPQGEGEHLALSSGGSEGTVPLPKVSSVAYTLPYYIPKVFEPGLYLYLRYLSLGYILSTKVLAGTDHTVRQSVHCVPVIAGSLELVCLSARQALYQTIDQRV